MVKAEDRDKFIELRAAGLSFDSIAQQLNISKPTLLKLARDFQGDIERLKFINLESLAERYKVLRSERLKALGGLLEKVDTAIEAADFNRLSPEKLVDLKVKLTDCICSMLKEPFSIQKSTFNSMLEQDNDFDFTLNID